jgi:deoxyribodipyrimidine photolyase-related protein
MINNMNMTNAVLIYPHQLFEKHPMLSLGIKIFLIEEPLMFTQYTFHKQKLILHRASMQVYKDFLISKGFDVEYVEHSRLQKTEDIVDILGEYNIVKVGFCDVVDDWLNKKLIKALDLKKIEYEIVDTPLFITTQEDLDSFFLPVLAQNKKLMMGSFYTWQRKRLNILIESDGTPMGGKWSHDEDNRKKIPAGFTLPKVPTRM